MRAAAAAVVGICALNVAAAPFTWDADGAGAATGGTGPWNTSAATWFDGTNYVVWPNGSPNTDTAIFPASSGTVSLGAGILANALRFDAGGYVIDNGGVAGNVLTLSGPNPTITVSNAGDLATISAAVSGTGPLGKAGPGTLMLSNTTNNWTGGLTVSGGTLELRPTAANTPVIFNNTLTTSLAGNLTAGTVLIDGGTLKLSPTGTGNIALGTGGTPDNRKGITFGPNGGTLDLTNTTNVTGTGGTLAGDIPLTMNGGPVVIKFNGGNFGLSNTAAPNRSLRIPSPWCWR